MPVNIQRTIPRFFDELDLDLAGYEPDLSPGADPERPI